MAARTERIRLGTGVLLAPMFDPLRLAEDAATVDLLSGGRLILGLGIGWRDEEFEGFGVPTTERARRLEGTIAVLRQAWGDGLVTGDGRTFSYPGSGLNVTPKPVRGASSPIWIGAGAEPAVRRAGRIADGYLGSSASPAAIAERAAWVRDEAESVGRDPATIEIGVHRMTFAWRGPDAWSRVADAARYMSWKYEDMGPARASIERRRPPAMDAATEASLRSRVIAGTPEQVADAHPRLRPDARRARARSCSGATFRASTRASSARRSTCWSRRSCPSSAAEAPVSRRPAVGRDGARRACAVADNAPMHVIAVVAALVAAAIHVWFFVLESVQFTRPTVFTRFGIRSAEDAAIVRPMAFNQGFYNLFLAIGIVAGLGLVAAGQVDAGRAIVLFACASMVGAGVVLFVTNRHFLIGASIQAVPPLVAIVAGLLLAP